MLADEARHWRRREAACGGTTLEEFSESETQVELVDNNKEDRAIFSADKANASSTQEALSRDIVLKTLDSAVKNGSNILKNSSRIVRRQARRRNRLKQGSRSG